MICLLSTRQSPVNARRTKSPPDQTILKRCLQAFQTEREKLLRRSRLRNSLMQICSASNLSVRTAHRRSAARADQRRRHCRKRRCGLCRRRAIPRVDTIGSGLSIYRLSMHVCADWPLPRETTSLTAKTASAAAAYGTRRRSFRKRWRVLRCAAWRDRATSVPHLTAFNLSEGLTGRQSLLIV